MDRTRAWPVVLVRFSFAEGTDFMANSGVYYRSRFFYMHRSTFIPLSNPAVGPAESEFLLNALKSGIWRGDGPATRRMQRQLRLATGAAEVFLTTSATHALELAVRLSGIGPGDEVVMPSFTFVSTANAVVLSGGTPVFADIDPDTLNLDPSDVIRKTSERTRAIMPVHYGGTACDMAPLLAWADERNLLIIEDAAQGVDAYWNNRALGSIGRFGAYSFHDTKNISCGEGGALLMSRHADSVRAEILREKGTNRSAFLRGEVDKYTWMDAGSSYVPSDLLAALLEAQWSRRAWIRRDRAIQWQAYHSKLAPFETAGYIRRQVVPSYATTNHHTFFFTVVRPELRDPLLQAFRRAGIGAAFHYIPLHSAPFGRYLDPKPVDLPVTDRMSASLIRLPLFAGLTQAHPDAADRAFDVLSTFFKA
jgi:dTDP-4-amino-4,6-dideoxygalactose transaminase